MQSPSSHGSPRLRGAVAGVFGGVLAAVLGTSLHGHVVYSGDTAVQAGAVLALLFSCAVSVFVGLWGRSAVWSAVTGIVTYIVLGIFSSGVGESPLIVTGTSAEQQPDVVMAGMIWLFGQALATIAAVFITARVLSSDRRSARAADVSAAR